MSARKTAKISRRWQDTVSRRECTRSQGETGGFPGISVKNQSNIRSACSQLMRPTAKVRLPVANRIFVGRRSRSGRRWGREGEVLARWRKARVRDLQGRNRVMFTEVKHSRSEQEGKCVVEEGRSTSQQAGTQWEKPLNSHIMTNVIKDEDRSLQHLMDVNKNLL